MKPERKIGKSISYILLAYYYLKEFITASLIISLSSCTVTIKKINPGDYTAVENINVFDLPILTNDSSSRAYQFQIKRIRDTVTEIIPFFNVKRKPVFDFHLFRMNDLVGYWTEVNALHQCRGIDSFLVTPKKIFYAQECYKVKTNMIFEKIADDTVKVTTLFYDNDNYSRQMSLQNRNLWEDKGAHKGIYYLIRNKTQIIYDCRLPIDVFCPVDYNNFYTKHLPNSFFPHILYVARYSRY